MPLHLDLSGLSVHAFLHFVFLFSSLGLWVFLPMNRSVAAPPSHAMLQQEHGRFLSTCNMILSVSQGLGTLKQVICILDLGSFYIVEILRFKLLFFKYRCTIKLFLVSRLYIRKINKVPWAAGPTSGKTGPGPRLCGVHAESHFEVFYLKCNYWCMMIQKNGISMLALGFG